MTNIYLQLSWNLLHWRDVLEFSETRFFNECKRHCFLSRILVDTSLQSTPESGSLINTPELVNISPAWAGSCVLWMLTSLCCGKFLANTLPPPSSLLPPPSAHPTNGCIYPPRTDIRSARCSRHVKLKSVQRKNSTEIFPSRYWHCFVCRVGRVGGILITRG